MSQELTIYRQPDIHLEFADCEEYINIPIKPSDIGRPYTLDEDGVKCYQDSRCIDNVKFLISFPVGVEYESSTLSLGSYNPSTETIEIDSMCVGDIFNGTIKVKATTDCVYPFKVGITMTDDENCLVYEVTQVTLVSAGMTCKQVLSCINTTLTCEDKNNI